MDDPTKDGSVETKSVDEKKPGVEKVLLAEPIDEITLEFQGVCEKIFVIPKMRIDDHNIGIEYDITNRLEAKGLKVRKVNVERVGNPIKGEYCKSEVLIESVDIKIIENENFGIENCWVLPCI